MANLKYAATYTSTIVLAARKCYEVAALTDAAIYPYTIVLSARKSNGDGRPLNLLGLQPLHPERPRLQPNTRDPDGRPRNSQTENGNSARSPEAAPRPRNRALLAPRP